MIRCGVLDGVFISSARKAHQFLRFKPEGIVYGPVAVSGALEMIVRQVWSWLGENGELASRYRFDRGDFVFTTMWGTFEGTVVDPDTLSMHFQTYTRVLRPALIDLDRAGEQELLVLPGMSKARAKKLVAHRTTAGPFTSLDDLRRIPGFGAKLVAQVLPWVTIGSS